MGLLSPTHGRMTFNNNDITHLPIHKRARLGISYLAQEPSLLESLTVLDNLLCILERLPLSKKERLHRAYHHLDEMHIGHLAKHKAITLSGGERRRVEIARALSLHPKLLLLDEPFANIDPKTIIDLKALIHHLKSKHIAILITDHNAKELLSLSDHNYLLSGGRILASAPTPTFITHPTVQETYLGTAFSL